MGVTNYVHVGGLPSIERQSQYFVYSVVIICYKNDVLHLYIIKRDVVSLQNVTVASLW